MILEYDIGDVAQLEASFTDEDGAPADPTTVTATVRDPSGNVSSYIVTSGQIIRDGVGAYHLDVPVDEAGDWFASFVGTGAIASIEEVSFFGRTRLADADGPGRVLCTIVDVLRYAPGYDLSDDQDGGRVRDVLWALIQAESTAWLHLREFIEIPDQGTRSFDIGAHEARERTVWVGDLAAAETVTVKNASGTTVATIADTAYTLLPRVRETWQPYTRIRFSPHALVPARLCDGYVLEVEGTWGFRRVPDDVRQAVAKKIIVRYVNDVPSQVSTEFAEALAEVSVGGMLAAAREVEERYRRPRYR